MTRTLRGLFDLVFGQEDINFLVTNRIPRQLATRLMGWFSRIEQPLVRDLSIGLWRAFADLDLHEAKPARFRSLHECFIRELRDGARPVDPNPGIVVSPCDGIVEATGAGQASGFHYALGDRMGGEAAGRYRNGCYVTLRIASNMYHRFHAPHDCSVQRVTYFSGDTWNVNPIALKRVEQLFCKNERAAIDMQLAWGGHPLTLVAVAAVLVASIRLNMIGDRLHLRYRGPNVIRCSRGYQKGAEMGWFEHGSTILVFAPRGFALHEGLCEGMRLRMGEPLLRLP